MAAVSLVLLWLLSLIIESIDSLTLSSPVVVQEALIVCAYNVGCMQGKYMPGYQIDKFEAFLGIPYALPPVAELRFSNPKAYPKWSVLLNATVARPDCIQKNYLLKSPKVEGVEDCLYLNVYRPIERSGQQLPVMVYIHGGGWFTGSASPDFHGPEYFMDTKEVILVTFAYRLGALGFLSTNDINMPGNFGLKDQNLALRWVQKNIAAFGGDPKRVTIFGQSAGAVSAHMHVLSKQSEGLFRGIIALSGTANTPFAITTDPLQLARKTAELCNITNAFDLSSPKLSRILRSIDAEILVNSGDGLKYWDVDHLTNFRPVVEHSDDKEAFLTQHPKEILALGNYKAVPWMMGGVPQEGAVRALAILENNKLKENFNEHFDELLEKLIDFPEQFNRTQLTMKMKRIREEYLRGEHVLNNGTAQGFLDIITDRGFRQPFYNVLKTYVNTMNTKKYPIYLFNFNYKGPHTFSHIFSGHLHSRDYGVVHCDDLIYLFRSILFADFIKNSTHAAVVQAFVGNFVHFAKFGKPKNIDLFKPCDRYSFNTSSETICDYQEFMNLAPNSFQIKTDNKFNVRRMQMWNDIMEEGDDFILSTSASNSSFIPSVEE